RVRIERLRAENIERRFDAAAARGRQLVLRGAARDQLRHDGEVEDVAMPGTDRGSERLRLLARSRARKRGAPDVGELAHQRVDQRTELAALLRLRVAPC